MSGQKKDIAANATNAKGQQYTESDVVKTVISSMLITSVQEMKEKFQSDLENWSKSKRASFSE